MSIGYPDYSRTQAEAGNQLGSFFGQKQNDPTTGRMDCVGYAYLTIGVNDSANIHNYTIVVTFYDDFNLTNIIGGPVIVPVPGTRFPYQTPVISRYATVTCSHIVALDTEQIGCIVYGSNIQVSSIGDAQVGQPFIYLAPTLAAGASQTSKALFMHEGAATLYGGGSTGSLYTINLQFFRLATAAFVTFVSLDGSVEGDNIVRRVSLPPCPVQLQVTNNSGAAQVVTGSVVLG